MASNDGLRAALAEVDRYGWEAPAGRRVLEHARRAVVAPAVRSVGLRGAAAVQGEATGWAVAWEVLAGPGVRQARSPWGVVWVAVRRAVLGERLATAYGTDPWTAYRIRRHQRCPADHDPAARRAGDWSGAVDPAALEPPVSLTALAETDWEPATDPKPARDLGPRLDRVVQLLVAAGWAEPAARTAVEVVALSARRNGTTTREAPGWRGLAAELDVPLWQARRVTVLLLGAPGWPGLVERLVRHGADALDEPPVTAAVRSTVVEGLRGPAVAFHAALRRAERPPACAS